MTVYVPEEFTPPKPTSLRRYFTNLDGPVFALVNLPEVVKGALFARYSRSPKSLRRLFLDEFVGDLDITGDQTVDATIGLERAEELYEKVFFEYGDDSVAQLGGVHLACEQASQHPHQGARVGPPDELPRAEHALHRLRRPPRRPLPLLPRPRRAVEPLRHPLRRRHGPHVRQPTACCSPRSPITCAPPCRANPADSDFVYRQATRAKALDAVRGVLPAASLSNVGIYGSGQAFEALLLRMRVAPAARGPPLRRPDAARAAQGHPQLPAPRRPRRPRRALEPATWPTTRERTAELVRVAVRRNAGRAGAVGAAGRLRPRRRGQAARRDLLPAHATCPSTSSPSGCARSARPSGWRCIRAYVGERENRRHKPGRAFERVDYRFDVLSDYGAFRDLQRHRLLTIEWQPLTPEPRLRATRAGRRSRHDRRVRRRDGPIGGAVRRAEGRVPAAGAATRCRWPTACATRCSSTLARRSTCSSCGPSPQGHPSYRRVALEMHRLIAEQAGHRAVADAMTHMTTRGARARTARGRTPRRGPPRPVLSLVEVRGM